jgi:hypothetical protein
VEGGILTESINVAVKNTDKWADKVFQKDYNLKPLNEVEEFIKKNKHLPNIPSAMDVVEDGINVAEMNASLLEKIEELTLYVIGLNKENINLRLLIEKLDKGK